MACVCNWMVNVRFKLSYTHTHSYNYQHCHKQILQKCFISFKVTLLTSLLYGNITLPTSLLYENAILLIPPFSATVILSCLPFLQIGHVRNLNFSAACRFHYFSYFPHDRMAIALIVF